MSRATSALCSICVVAIMTVSAGFPAINSALNPGASGLKIILGKQADPLPFPSIRPRLQYPIALPFYPPPGQPPNGSPAIAFEGGEARVAVWPFWNGSNTELAVSLLTGSGWSVPAVLTNDAAEDVDPQVAFDRNGLPIVVWCRSSVAPVILITRRDAAGNWSREIAVSGLGESARHPSIVTTDAGATFLAYEVDGGTTTEVIVSRMLDRADSAARAHSADRADSALLVREFAVRTDFPIGALPILETLGKRVGLSWMAGPDFLGMTERIDSGIGTVTGNTAEPRSWREPRFIVLTETAASQ